jgi:hypothetical protein
LSASASSAASVATFSSSAATTRSSSCPTPTSSSPRAPSSSPPSAPRASAAPRCVACSSTTTVYDDVVARLRAAYASVKIGDPLGGALCGPLHSTAALDVYEKAIATATAAGGKVLVGGRRLIPAEVGGLAGNFVQPTLLEAPLGAAFTAHEAFVPILYVMRFKTLDQAIAVNNGVSQGLSSSLFTRDSNNVWKWIGPEWLRLRHCQRQHSDVGRRDWRRVWRQQGDGRRPRGRLRQLEAVHAPEHNHDQSRQQAAAGARHQLWQLNNKRAMREFSVLALVILSSVFTSSSSSPSARCDCRGADETHSRRVRALAVELVMLRKRPEAARAVPGGGDDLWLERMPRDVAHQRGVLRRRRRRPRRLRRRAPSATSPVSVS